MQETVLVLMFILLIIFVVIVVITRTGNTIEKTTEISKNMVKITSYNFDAYVYKGIVVGQFDKEKKDFCLRFDSAWDLNLSPNKFFNSPEKVYQYALKEAPAVLLKQVEKNKKTKNKNMENLKQYTITQLENELAERLLDNHTDNVIPIVFAYSKKNNQFDTKFIKIKSVEDVSKISSLMLRARFNQHREIKIYSIKLPEHIADEFNVEFFNQENETELFNKLMKFNPLEIDF